MCWITRLQIEAGVTVMVFFFFLWEGACKSNLALYCVPVWSLLPWGFSWSCCIRSAWGARGPVCMSILQGRAAPVPQQLTGGSGRVRSQWQHPGVLLVPAHPLVP